MQPNTPSGLSSDQVSRRLEKFGQNYVVQRRFSWWLILSRQFRSPFIYLLLGASIVSGLLSSLTDALAILVFILLNTVLGFYQEFTSERTIQALEEYLKFYTRTYRDGQVKRIPNTHLVPEDIIELRPGNIIPADVEFIDARGLLVDESSISGESIPVAKKAKDKGFSGTSVTSGSALAEITATGSGSTLGKIAAAAESGSSTFEKDIADFSRFVLKLVLITLAALFLVNLVIKGPAADLVELLLFCIALAVSVIPEALPVVITFSLSRGASHLARNKVVVKKLLSIEDLGGIQVLATDKTGTLTENKLVVSDILSENKCDLYLWTLLGSEAVFTDKKNSDPFDNALSRSVTAEHNKSISDVKLVSSSPFDPVHRTSATLVDTPEGRFFVFRGAPESILPDCHLAASRISDIKSWVSSKGMEGCRVLACARKPAGSLDTLPESAISGMELVGLVSFADPVKKTAAAAVSTAKKLGVRIVILTGDAPEVAGQVAAQIGLINSQKEVMTGDRFESLSGDKQLQALENCSVFARTSPFQKNTIVDALQTRYSVGFMGDGINDAVALDSADVGLAVSNATQVARQAADIVLLEKDLKVVVDGIREGRIIAANTSKYITSTMASNFGNFYAVAVSSLFIEFLPMLPLQILALNLLSDFPMISIATDTVDPEETAMPSRFHVHSFIDLAMVLGIVSTLFDFLFFALYFRISASVLQTNWFIGSILTELVFIYSIRTKKPFFRSARPSFYLILLTGFAFLATLFLPYTLVGSSVFSFTPPGISYIVADLLLVLAYFITTESVKLIYFRFRRKPVSS